MIIVQNLIFTPSYLPSTYILFAIWNIPMKLLGVIQVPDLEIPYVALMWSETSHVFFIGIRFFGV